MRTVNGEYLQCNVCKRKSVLMVNVDSICEMRHPSKEMCDGILKLKKEKDFHKEVIEGLVKRSNWGKVNNNILLSRILCFISPEVFNKEMEKSIDYHFSRFVMVNKLTSDFDFDELLDENKDKFKKLINDFYLMFTSSFRKLDVVDTLDKSTLTTSLNGSGAYAEGEYSANGAMDMVIWEALNTEHDLSIILRTIIVRYMMSEYSIKNIRKNILDK
jgi:hypothetical protein